MSEVPSGPPPKKPPLILKRHDAPAGSPSKKSARADRLSFGERNPDAIEADYKLSDDAARFWLFPLFPESLWDLLLLRRWMGTGQRPGPRRPRRKRGEAQAPIAPPDSAGLDGAILPPATAERAKANDRYWVRDWRFLVLGGVVIVWIVLPALKWVLGLLVFDAILL